MYRLQAAAKQLRLHKDVAHALDTYGNVSNGKLWETPDSKPMKHCCDCKGKKQWWYVVVKSEDSSVHSLLLIGVWVGWVLGWWAAHLTLALPPQISSSQPSTVSNSTWYHLMRCPHYYLLLSCSLSQLVVEIIKLVHYTILWGLACEVKKYIFSTFYILHG